MGLAKENEAGIAALFRCSLTTAKPNAVDKTGHSPILVGVLGSAPSMRDRTARIKTQKSLTQKMPRVYKVWTAP